MCSIHFILCQPKRFVPSTWWIQVRFGTLLRRGRLRQIAFFLARDDIGILGLLHNVRLKKCHPNLISLFRMAAPLEIQPRPSRHPQLHVPFASSLIDHIISAHARIYNLLDPDIVALDNVRDLQVELIAHCQNNNLNWEYSLSCRHVHFIQRIG